MLDIFNNDAFGVVHLTTATNEQKHVPSRITDMGLFEVEPTSKLTIAIENENDVLKLVAPSPRGGPGDTAGDTKRKLRAFPVPHFQRDWSVMADEVQGVRELGQEQQMKTVMKVVDGKIRRRNRELDATEEKTRLGAVIGEIVYEDGSTTNMFDEFGVVQDAVIEFNFAGADGTLRKQCTDIIRKTRDDFGSNVFDHIHAFCGDNFFDGLLGSKELRDTYKGWNQAQILRESYVGQSRSNNPMYKFGEIIYENYGAVGSAEDKVKIGIGVGTNDVHFFPVGAPGLFRTFYAPADYIETVNTLGLRRYSKQFRMRNDKGINGETQTNMLQLCTMPKALKKGKIAGT